MILPVVAYGHTVLKKKAQEIGPDYPGLNQFIADFWETMYQADGVGLAAPQVNRSIRLFAIDASPFVKDHPEVESFKKLFINAEIYREEGEEWSFNEGCLSFPGMREDIMRKPVIWMKWVDEAFKPYDQRFEGIVARVIQHEYDHIEGILMVDRINSLKRVLLNRKLNDISKGNIDTSYKMLFPQLKKRKKL
ncbi:MAG: peptide deformylase [Bacteroidetes bacterium]|nr:peptide deformylase [Bacteroidota bacterium]